ncbi:MAG TPA: ATP-dependent DNA ligase [Streptosporangiaceae bacterium]|nr:ATP-dependent DNA ligase [Streptosporangiaceae bacterium]
MLLDRVVRTSAAVAATRSRLAKIDEIAALLREVPAGEIAVAVSFLAGDLTQRQIGVGYAALTDLLGGYGQTAPPAADLADAPMLAELTLTETDQALGHIGALAGPGSQAERRRLLASLLSRATETERQFLVRLLAGDLRQGALDGVMIDAVARAASVPGAEIRRAHQLSGSLPAAAAAALGADSTDAAIEALRAVGLEVGRAIRPMLAASAPTVAAALERISPAAVEWKIDGVRVQVHRQGSDVRVFTRTLDDITSRVPELVAAAMSLNLTAAVLDGEAVALRPNGRPLPFQVTSARAASQSGQGGPNGSGDQDDQSAPAGQTGQAGRVPLALFLFDLLHLDGTDLLDHPAADRYARLAAVAPSELVIPRLVTGEVRAAEQFFAEAIDRGHEGVVIKSLDAAYGAGRRGSEWIKVKPRHTLDLLVLAAEWGHGRRQGWLSNLHLGARDPATGGTVMLGKTFKGLTDALLAWQTERLLDLADPPVDRSAQVGPGGGLRGVVPPSRHGVVRVKPVLVVEVAFDGVQASSRYPGGVTLRFARVLRYRPDKSPAEADTIDAVRALWSGGDLAAADRD